MSDAVAGALESIAIAGREHEELLDAFHAGVYLAEFAAQREPVEIWKARLWGNESGDEPAPYALAIRVIGHALGDRARREPLGGIAYEFYPRSRCGLVTYMVVAPSVRQRGVGKALLADAVAALHARGATWVFGEVVDPRRAPGEAAWRRLERNQRWGARVVDAAYVQPALSRELARDRSLCLIALAPPTSGASLPPTIPGADIATFVRELFEVTEGVPLDAEARALIAALGEHVPLVELRR